MSTILLIPVAPPPKSKAQQLAKLLPSIEAALKQGYSHEVIHEHITKTAGLELTYKYYKTTLHRIRQRQKAKSPATSRASLPLLVSRTAGVAEQAAPAADATLDQPERRFTYDLKGSIDDFF